MTTIDFDHHAADFRERAPEVYARLRRECPIGFTANHGGFWVVSRYDDVFAAAHDQTTYSSAFSVVVPPTDVGFLPPLEVDSPDLERYRRMMARFFTPHATRRIEPSIRNTTERAIDRFIDRGRAELVAELANPVPAITTMQLLGMDPEDWHFFAGPLHDASYAPPGSPMFADAVQRIGGFTDRIAAEVDSRIDSPRADMISQLLADESAPTRDQVIGLVRMVIFGGMDTVSATMSNVFVRLGRDPELRTRLTQAPELIPAAVEEFLRLDPPIQGFSRKVRQPCSLAGQTLDPGDVVFLLWASANRDESVFDRPEEVLLDRSVNRHMAFGVGPHRCQGSTLARAEMRIMLAALLERLRDYELVEEEVVPPATIGIANGWMAVGVTFG
jgi:cytochrome P450